MKKIILLALSLLFLSTDSFAQPQFMTNPIKWIVGVSDKQGKHFNLFNAGGNKVPFTGSTQCVQSKVETQKIDQDILEGVSIECFVGISKITLVEFCSTLHSNQNIGVLQIDNNKDSFQITLGCIN